MSKFEDRMIRPEEVSELVGAGPKTLANWRFEGKGPKYVKMGKFVRYWLSEVLRWSKEHEVDPAA